MYVKDVPLELIILTDTTMFSLLDLIEKEIDGFTYEINVNDLTIVLFKDEMLDKYNEFITELYNESMTEFLNTSFNSKYRIEHARIITFLDRLYLNKKNQLDT